MLSGCCEVLQRTSVYARTTQRSRNVHAEDILFQWLQPQKHHPKGDHGLPALDPAPCIDIIFERLKKKHSSRSVISSDDNLFRMVRDKWVPNTHRPLPL
jgi:hypothetical protein